MNVLFKTEEMKRQFLHDLHPKTAGKVVALAELLGKPLTVTEVIRTDGENEAIYMVIAARLLAADPKTLGPIDTAQLQQLQALSPSGQRLWARQKPTWHKGWTAVDMSLKGLSTGDLAMLADFAHKECLRPMWEAILEPHGTGPHFHLACRDFGWLKQFPGGLRSNQGKKKAP